MNLISVQINLFQIILRKIKLILTDVSNLSAIKDIVSNNKPSIIFHAAANKHVDIVEDNGNYSIYNTNFFYQKVLFSIFKNIF